MAEIKDRLKTLGFGTEMLKDERDRWVRKGVDYR